MRGGLWLPRDPGGGRRGRACAVGLGLGQARARSHRPDVPRRGVGWTVSWQYEWTRAFEKERAR